MRYITYFLGLLFALTAVQTQAKELDAVDGKALFEANCAKCHGEDGSVSDYGRTLKPFPARNLRAVAGLVDRDELRRLITYGIHGTAMTPKKYKLDPLLVEAVIDYIESLDYKPDLTNGKRRFLAVCSRCHGRDGRAKTGVGAKNLVYSRLDLKGIAHTMRYGRSGTMMTSKRHQISNTDIADVAHYVYSLRYRASPERGKKLYAENCASCHAHAGEIRLRGNRARPSMSIRGVNDRVLDLRIRHGRHVDRAGEKVAKLPADDVQDIIYFLRLSLKESAPAR